MFFLSLPSEKKSADLILFSAQILQQVSNLPGATNTTNNPDYQRNPLDPVSNFWSNQGLVGKGAVFDDVASHCCWVMGQLS
jgi:hypothetical protein